jgi:hypothetical protein
MARSRENFIFTLAKSVWEKGAEDSIGALTEKMQQKGGEKGVMGRLRICTSDLRYRSHVNLRSHNKD